MRVAELQQFIRSLIPPLQSSGAKASVVDGLEGMAGGLEPFKELAVEPFADFLRRAEEYDRTGIVPVVAKAATKPRAPKAVVAAYTVDEALRDLRSLQDRSIGEDVTYAAIASEVKKLDKLKKPDLDAVTIEIGLGKAKSKAAAIDAVTEKITNFKKSHQRNQF
jgi:hypothetical protein